jgi:hypothetical protein
MRVLLQHVQIGSLQLGNRMKIFDKFATKLHCLALTINGSIGLQDVPEIHFFSGAALAET